ncbi:MAG: AAA family ATPase, partial [Spirochaetales bacterium]|nr:AAA family ATPase [Spirochaetales bacterium]
DIIMDFGIRQRAFEVKSSKTVNEKFFDTLKYWHSLTGSEWENLYLIYGGEENYRRNGMNVISWNNIFEGIVKDTI